MANKETGLICTGESVRGILDGRKTQTRRVVKPQPTWVDDAKGGKNCIWLNSGGGWYCPVEHAVKNNFCPYGQVGDRLWVRETFAYYPDGDHVIFKEREGNDLGKLGVDLTGCWKSSRFMPKKFARIWLEITGIRVERVQDISLDDIYTEGFAIASDLAAEYGDERIKLFAFEWWQKLWDSLNTKRGYGWDKNPWVWVIEFKRLNQKGGSK